MFARIADALGVTADVLLMGNQTHDPAQYQTDIDMILADCTSYEKSVLVESMRSLKGILRENSTYY